MVEYYFIRECICVTGQVYEKGELYEFIAVVDFRKKTPYKKGKSRMIYFDTNLTDEYKKFLTDEIREHVLDFILHQSEEIKETTSLPFDDKNKTTKYMTPLENEECFLFSGAIQMNYIGESEESPELLDFNFEVIRDEIPIDGIK